MRDEGLDASRALRRAISKGRHAPGQLLQSFVLKMMDAKEDGCGHQPAAHTGGAQTKLVTIGGNMTWGRERLLGKAQATTHDYISRHKRCEVRHGSVPARAHGQKQHSVSNGISLQR